MHKPVRYQPHKVIRRDRADGTILLDSELALGEVARRSGDWLEKWGAETPDAVFLAERSGAGWRQESYRSTLQKVHAIAASLLARGLNENTPVLILSGNGIEHGLLTLAAQYVGIPAVPVAEQYSLIEAAHGRLIEIVDIVRPKMAFAADGNAYGKVMTLEKIAAMDRVSSRPAATGATSFDELLRGDSSVDVNAAKARVGPDTVAKILMTSGSTSTPKGVLTTQQMMCANQAQIAACLPFLRDKPPRIVDWLPWNHVFGGSHNFNMMLANGGALYVDDGKPVKGLFDRTVENLGLVGGTISFNVPVGFGMLLGRLRADEKLRQTYFGDLDMIFYAGASLPNDIWTGLRELAIAVQGREPLVNSSWGLTETAPAALLQHELTTSSGIVGVPLPGCTVKLVPDEAMRCEVRVKGPNVMPGYFENPEKTAESFDEEGFFRTGDAMVFVDANDPSKGMRFDGRISEDFKLQTGTWVRAAALRLEMLACLAPYAADVIVTGHDRREIGVMIIPSREAVAEMEIVDDAGALVGDRLREEIGNRLSERAKTATGSSMRIGRALVLSQPASIADGEITAKGNLNFRKILSRRVALLERLYDDGDKTTIRI